LSFISYLEFFSAPLFILRVPISNLNSHVFFSLKADSLFPRRLKSRFTKTKPASWEVEEKREHSLTKDQAKDKDKPVVVPRRTPVGKAQTKSRHLEE
jgi:hypothetical protein